MPMGWMCMVSPKLYRLTVRDRVSLSHKKRNESDSYDMIALK